MWMVLLLLAVTLSPALAAAQLILDGGATLTVPPDIAYDTETIGLNSTGSLTQSGGSNTVTTRLIVGGNAGANGTYNLSGGSLSAPNEYIGFSGTGTFTQSGGTNTLGSSLFVGGNAGANGTYKLSGTGSLSANSEYIGYTGTGTFTQSGGTNTVATFITLGLDPTGASTYNLSGGSLSANSEYIGYSGTATFNQSGGTNTVAGGLIIGSNPGSRGTYNFFGGSLSAGTVDVNSGGVFRGFGALDSGTFTNRGLVAPGASPGTLTINGGPYIQTASGTLEVEVASPTSYDKLNVIGVPGTASLNGTLKPVLLNGYIPRGNQVFPGVVSAANGITGTFSTVANFSPTLLARALYSNNAVDLMAVRDYTNPFLAPLTHNQYAVGLMLNGLANTATGDLNTVLNAIDSLPSVSAVANAYQQISADKVAALSTLAFAEANLQKRVLSRRLTDLRFGRREAGVLGGLPGSFNLNYSQAAGLMLAYNSANLAGMVTSGRQAGLAPPEGRWGVYLDPAMVFGAQDSSTNQTGFDFTIAGFNAGADYRLRDDLLVGLATGYSHTGASFHGSGGSVENSTWPLTAYAAYLPQCFYAYGSLGYALNLFDLKRQISFGGLNRIAKSSPTGNQLNIYGEAGYDLRFRRLVVTPVVSLAYSSLWVDRFTESGAGALNLNISSQQATSLQTGVGGKIALPIKRSSTVVVPQIYASYQHEYSDSSRGLDARLSQAGNTFVFQTDNPDRNFAVAGADVTILARKNLTVQLDYNAEVGRGNYTAHYVSAGVRWQF
jgi:outer membrane autotransporter protein